MSTFLTRLLAVVAVLALSTTLLTAHETTRSSHASQQLHQAMQRMHADLRQMAGRMIAAQSAEIVELRTWLAAEAED